MSNSCMQIKIAICTFSQIFDKAVFHTQDNNNTTTILTVSLSYFVTALKQQN